MSAWIWVIAAYSAVALAASFEILMREDGQTLAGAAGLALLWPLFASVVVLVGMRVWWDMLIYGDPDPPRAPKASMRATVRMLLGLDNDIDDTEGTDHDLYSR